MNSASLTLAFGAGMLATVNPCGFAMLPAYLSYFLGIDAADGNSRSTVSVPTAIVTGGAVSLGFVVVFGIIGVVLRSFLGFFNTWLPYVAVAIGITLVGLGIALLAGKHLTVLLPRFDAGHRSRTLWSMFVFGVSYAITSLGCTIGPFVSAVGSVFRRQSLLDGVSVFVAYSLGMASILIALTVATALAKQGLVHRLRAVLPYVDRIAGALMVVAGMYVTYYGLTEVTNTTNSTITRRGSDISTRLTAWLDERGTGQVGIVLGILVALALVLSVVRTRHRRQTKQADEPVR